MCGWEPLQWWWWARHSWHGSFRNLHHEKNKDGVDGGPQASSLSSSPPPLSSPLFSSLLSVSSALYIVGPEKSDFVCAFPTPLASPPTPPPLCLLCCIVPCACAFLPPHTVPHPPTLPSPFTPPPCSLPAFTFAPTPTCHHHHQAGDFGQVLGTFTGLPIMATSCLPTCLPSCPPRRKPHHHIPTSPFLLPSLWPAFDLPATMPACLHTHFLCGCCSMPCTPHSSTPGFLGFCTHCTQSHTPLPAFYPTAFSATVLLHTTHHATTTYLPHLPYAPFTVLSFYTTTSCLYWTGQDKDRTYEMVLCWVLPTTFICCCLMYVATGRQWLAVRGRRLTEGGGQACLVPACLLLPACLSILLYLYPSSQEGLSEPLTIHPFPSSSFPSFPSLPCLLVFPACTHRWLASFHFVQPWQHTCLQPCMHACLRSRWMD